MVLAISSVGNLDCLTRAKKKICFKMKLAFLGLPRQFSMFILVTLFLKVIMALHTIQTLIKVLSINKIILCIGRHASVS